MYNKGFTDEKSYIPHFKGNDRNAVYKECDVTLIFFIIYFDHLL